MQFVEKRKFGIFEKLIENDIDVDDELASLTESMSRSSLKKLGPWQTYFTLMKGFVCTGVLYLPSTFKDGGWLFTDLSLILSAFLTAYCGILLLEVRQKVKKNSYTQIGKLLYGKTGKLITDISLCLSQAGFCCGFIFFIKENIH